MAKKTTDALAVPRRRATSGTRRAMTTAKEPAAPRDPSFEEIAEAAYHRYLKRGGGHGTDYEDWLEAERDLRSRKNPNSQ